jgi:hypothetical protein
MSLAARASPINAITVAPMLTRHCGLVRSCQAAHRRLFSSHIAQHVETEQSDREETEYNRGDAGYLCLFHVTLNHSSTVESRATACRPGLYSFDALPFSLILISWLPRPFCSGSFEEGGNGHGKQLVKPADG